MPAPKKRPQRGKVTRQRVTPLAPGTKLPRTVASAAEMGLSGIPLPPPPYGQPFEPPLVFSGVNHRSPATRFFARASRKVMIYLLAVLTLVWFACLELGYPIVRMKPSDDWLKRAYCMGAAFTDFVGRSDRYLSAGNCPSN
jgi:hypothetical protein